MENLSTSQKKLILKIYEQCGEAGLRDVVAGEIPALKLSNEELEVIKGGDLGDILKFVKDVGDFIRTIGKTIA